MDGECIFCGESGNWCRCDEQEFTKEADIENLIVIKRYGTCVLELILCPCCSAALFERITVEHPGEVVRLLIEGRLPIGCG